MKKASSLLLTAALILSMAGCSGESSLHAEEMSQSTADIASEQVETESSESATVTSQSSTESSAPSPSTTKRYSLYNYTLNELHSFNPSILEFDRDLVAIYDGITSKMHRIEDISTISFHHDDVTTYVRPSTRILRADGYSEEDILSYMTENGNEYEPNSQFSSEYYIAWEDPLLTVDHNASDGIKAKHFMLGYVLYSKNDHASMNTRGFLRRKPDSAEELEFVIDPAYTYGMPMLSSLPENMRFDINGREVYADTLSFNIHYSDEDIPQELTEEYVYAELEYHEMKVCYFASDYDEYRGYDNTMYISDISILTDNTDSVIDNGFLLSDAEKDPEMTAVYDAIVSRAGDICNEKTIGMTLLDLDFDGTPELLKSDRVDLDSEYEYGSAAADVTVYTIKNGILSEAGVIRNAIYKMDSISNNIGLKPLSDGSYAWHITSYLDEKTGELIQWGTDYLYTLENGTLKAQEIFAERYENDEASYYIFGEPAQFSETQEMVSYYDEEPYLETIYELNGISSPYKDMVFGLNRERYCHDIEKSYNLSSDWLSTDIKDPISITERELTYNIAYLVDCFYLGAYNPALHQNYYGFTGAMAKPVLYLYPEEETQVSVQVDFAHGGEITVSYPEYNDGWNVTAQPDGTLFDENGDEYYCLYWEADGNAALDMSKGFCVRGEDTADLLRESLLHIGLTPREANEFIIYWLPQMQDNEYNVISLHTEEYARSVPLCVSPAPDSEIRVFMTYYPSDTFVDIAPQQLPSYDRNGFTIVEWGGGIVE